MSDYKIDLVEIMPIEYHKATWQFNKRKGKPVKVNPRLQIYWDFRIDTKITQEDMDKIIKETHMKKKARALVNPNDRVEWKYGEEPNIIILKKYPNKIFTTKSVLNEYGENRCQQQASIVLRILKKHGFAFFKRRSATFNPERIGRTREERRMVFEAAHNLFNDKRG